MAPELEKTAMLVKQLSIKRSFRQRDMEGDDRGWTLLHVGARKGDLKEYYYFIRLMGRKASHVALECTLQSHPNMVILAKEVAASKLTIFDLTNQICDAVQARAEKDKYHGVILIPEGLVESIPELYALIQEIHGLHRQDTSSSRIG